MDKLRSGSATMSIVLCLFLLVSLSAFGNQHLRNDDDDLLPQKTSLLKMLKSTFSLSTTPLPPPAASTSCWNKAQTLFNQVQSYFFPPNLDFRASEKDGGGEGAREKVKNAVAKSFGKSKATVEESAKSAAKLAGETLHKTAQKIKTNDEAEEEDSRTEL